MKTHKWLKLTILILIICAVATGVALAEDGQLFRRNISKTPEEQTGKSNIFMMDFYVPAQAATGELVTIENYIDLDGLAAYEPRDYAKPLVSVYIDEMGSGEEALGNALMTGVTFGAFDSFVAISLDDGTTWKNTNISRSADLSSFTLKNGEDFPGMTHGLVHQVFGDNIILAWASKYCDGGAPLYTRDPLSEHIADLETTYEKDAVYLYDLFGVAGNQKSVDFTEEGFPEVGEIPYSCIWAARGKLLPGDDPSTTDKTETTYIMWAKPERLTSGRRDANLPAVDCAGGAGCILVWQEDPDGLRPGQGLGPGLGWSGAIANQQTDMWYSYISATEFDLVFAAEDTVGAITMADYALLSDTSMPKSYVPMAMPVRLTDNAMCKATPADDPYCYIDFDSVDDLDPTALPTAPEADADFCAEQVAWTNPGGVSLTLCVTDDDRLLNGRVAATRTRMNLKPYDSDGDTINDSAWVVMAYEETKALGDVVDENLDPIDIGKDVWYHSFDMFTPDIVAQGGMLNQPAVDRETGEFFEVQVDTRGYDYYLTEISRRFALTTNSVQAAIDSESGLSAMLIYKQGIINQGGPADIMLRRTLIDDTVFDPAIDNPYAYGNMECAEWAYTDGSNPNYLQGLCLSPAISISGSTIVRCDVGSDNDSCADAFPIADDGSNPTGTTVPKVYEWRQCQPGSQTDICVDNNDDTDLDDQSWENPYDVAKGHRGFLDGDIVMIMYAWSPNWNANAEGNDHYNLYVRRSFDGGVTWTTTPGDLGGEGTTYNEYYYGTKIGEPVVVPWTYGANEPEQARNVSQLTGNRITVLDPRYTPAGGLKLYPTIRTDWLTDNGFSFEGLPYDDDLERDASKFFVVYETGDNTVDYDVAASTPLDLFYSRAMVFGDTYEIMDYMTSEDDLLLDRWPWLEKAQDDLSGEAGVVTNPGATFMYAVWNQWQEEALPDGHELIHDSDNQFRRLMYIPDDDLTERAPIAEILFKSHDFVVKSLGGELTFIGTGRDLDNLGDKDVVGFEWTSSIDGLLGTEQIFTAAVDSLSDGVHTISFTVVDGEGQSSRPISFTLWVTDSFFSTSLPIVVK